MSEPMPMPVEELMRALTAIGFTVGKPSILDPDGIAYRRIKEPTRPCECNGPNKAQIVVRPHTVDGHRGAFVAVQLVGETGGIWYNIEAYSLSPEEALSHMDTIALALTRAWNALA